MMSESSKTVRRKKTTGKTETKRRTTSKRVTEELKTRLAEAEAIIAELNDRLLRSAAEMDNIRKRTEREIAQVIQNANERLIKDLLPIIDDFERCLKLSPPVNEESGFRQGVQLVYDKMMSIIAGYGLEPIESMDQPFDVDMHDALLQVEKEMAPPGIVVGEHERGYALNGKVLRHAKVIVSK